MDNQLEIRFNELSSKDDKIRMEALQSLLKVTDEPVDWVYEVWDDLFRKLDDENSFQRSIAIMILCNLAKSDTEDRLSQSIDRLLAHTRDEKFITSRQCLQHVWKIAIANPGLKTKIVGHLEKQYLECINDKHYNLIRLDILQAMKNIYDEDLDQSLKDTYNKLLPLENNPAYRKKYELVWK